MQEELFGPLLPVLSVSGLDEAIERINQRPKPLALYLFTKQQQAQRQILERTSSGGVCLNDVVMQVGVPDLPFGGVGPSGMGSYHGEAGFRTFSHQRSVLRRPFKLDVPFRYPPYGDKLPLVRRLLGLAPRRTKRLPGLIKGGLAHPAGARMVPPVESPCPHAPPLCCSACSRPDAAPAGPGWGGGGEAR